MLWIWDYAQTLMATWQFWVALIFFVERVTERLRPD